MARILIADDDPFVRQLVGLHLLSQGHSVLEAETGKSALQSIADSPPDLVVLDSMMPSGDGPAVLRHLRADPATRTIPVLMLSARTRSDDKVEAFAIGADDCVSKPFDAPELVSRISRMLIRQAGV